MNINIEQECCHLAPEGIIRNIMDKARGMTRPVFRGQANANWGLYSGAVSRLQKSYGDSILENDFRLQMEIERYHQDLIKQMLTIERNNLNNLDQLSRLQHMGVATGLLDFTENLLVALLFACKDEIDKDGKVFIQDIGNPQIAQDGRDVDYHKLKEIDNKIIYYIPNQSLGSRIVAQQSVFVICNLPKLMESYFKPVVVPRTVKYAMIDHLNYFGISEKSIFPDIYGIAKLNGRDESLAISVLNNRDLGNKEYQSKRYNNARDYYRSYSLEYSDYAEPYSLIGDTLVALLLYDEAMLEYNRAIEMIDQSQFTTLKWDPYQPGFDKFILYALYFNRGNVHAVLGRHEQAISDYDKAMEYRDSQRRNILYNRGNAKYSLERYEEAFYDFKSAWNEQQDSDAALAMGNCKVLSKDFKEGAKWYREGVRIGVPEITANHCTENLNQLRKPLEVFDGNENKITVIDRVIEIESTVESIELSFVGNRGNVGNTGERASHKSGGEGYPGISGFVIRSKKKNN